MHYINVHNKSEHDQEYEVHSFNDNKKLLVIPGATAVFPAPDRTSGAVIALHDGHEGEQAEITKDGYMGMLEPRLVQSQPQTHCRSRQRLYRPQ